MLDQWIPQRHPTTNYSLTCRAGHASSHRGCIIEAQPKRQPGKTWELATLLSLGFTPRKGRKSDIRRLGDMNNKKGFSHSSASKTQQGRPLLSLPLTSYYYEASIVPFQSISSSDDHKSQHLCGSSQAENLKVQSLPSSLVLCSLGNRADKLHVPALTQGQQRQSFLGPEGGLVSSASNMNKLWVTRQTLLDSMQPLQDPAKACAIIVSAHGPNHPCPTQNRGAQGKLTFGFIVPRTLQIVDLVNTCRARVPHLLRLLPPPTLKSWAAAMILKGDPHPKIPKRLWWWQKQKECSEVRVSLSKAHVTPALPTPPPSSPCPPQQRWRPETATSLLRPLCAHGLPAPKPEICRLHRANAIVYRVLDRLIL